MKIPSVLHLPYVLNSALGLYKYREADQQSHITTRLGNDKSSLLSWKFSVSAIGTCGSLLHLTSSECGKWECKSLSHVRICDPTDYTVHGILQARILEWVAISFSRDLPDPEIKLAVSCIAGRFFTTEPPGTPSSPGFWEFDSLGGTSPLSIQPAVTSTHGSWGGCSGSIGPGQLSREPGTG